MKCSHRISTEDKHYLKSFNGKNAFAQCLDCSRQLMLVKDYDYDNEYFILELGER